MRIPLYTQASGARKGSCPVRPRQPIAWCQGLPAPIRALVVAPVRFDVLQEYEIPADRTQGYDDNHEPCFCAFRYVVTRLRSDDDEVFYEAPVYTETLTSWRLPDARWLVCRTTMGDQDRGEFRTDFSLSDTMPR